MFSRLVASARGRSQFQRPAVIIGSVAAHAALLAGIVWASSPAAEVDTTVALANEEVTYIDISEIPPPEDMVFEEPPADVQPLPAPVAVQAPAAPRPARPAAPRQTTPAHAARAAAQEPAGFQELRTPPRVLGVPAPDPTQAAVSAVDFGGRGQAGGTAGGTPPAGTGTTGSGTVTAGTVTAGTAGGTGTGTAPPGPPTGTFSANLVDRAASLSNRDEITRLLQRFYPAALRDAGVEGSVQVQFVVGADGRVDMQSVEIISTTHSMFTEASLRALREFRFRPARKGEHNVRMLTTLPIQWKLQQD
jgi:TonB family protein